MAGKYGPPPVASSGCGVSRSPIPSPLMELRGEGSALPGTAGNGSQKPIEGVVRGFDRLTRSDVDFAGGKGANLGELTAAGLPVPGGFVVGAPAYAAFRDRAGLRERLESTLAGVDVEVTDALKEAAGRARQLIESEAPPSWLTEAVADAYAELCGDEADAAVAVRSSATAEDTESASFAGMNETFLNVRGSDAVLGAVQRCWSSLFGARTVFYRAQRGLPQAEMDIAVVIQRHVEATRSGVMFTIDPASGREDQIVIEASLGLGEAVVSGAVSPDRFVVGKHGGSIDVRDIRTKRISVEPGAKGGTETRTLAGAESSRPSLTDEEVLEVARLGRLVESHYGAPQDTEWAIDESGKVWMLQSRPVTAIGGRDEPAVSGTEDAVLVRGLGAAPGQGSGPVRIAADLSDAADLVAGEILVTPMTAPDWVPLMKRAAAIVTDSGGMTCHAAIVSRELGIPCIVGTSEATEVLEDGQLVTVDATEGVVRDGEAAPSYASVPEPPAPAPADASPVTATRILVNLSEPSQLHRAASLRVDGVGLLRAELMIVEALEGVHPRSLVDRGGGEEFTARLARGLTDFATAFAPRPITYRTIDFRTNEFRGLEGGEDFEPQEANPMIGYRGALRYMHEPDLLRLELEAVTRVWGAGHQNLHVMLPFVRTAKELQAADELVRAAGLRDQQGFELWVMAEVPSVLFNLERYAQLGIAGISIGSNDLTQLVLGADRDSELLSDVFDERDPAVVTCIEWLIRDARGLGLATSICGQAPSVYPEYADILVRAGIDAISVNVDAVDETRRLVAAAEQRLILDRVRSPTMKGGD